MLEPEKLILMKKEVPTGLQSGYLIYDSHCRLCVAVKRKLEQVESFGQIEFVPYESQKAVEYLGKRYQADCRPSMAYWVDKNGTVIGGLEAFLPGLTSRKIFMFFWRFRSWRLIMFALYRFVARHRYRWFGASKEL